MHNFLVPVTIYPRYHEKNTGNLSTTQICTMRNKQRICVLLLVLCLGVSIAAAGTNPTT